MKKLNNPALDGVLFQTWDLESVHACAVRLSLAYENELPIRRKVMQEIAHSKTKEELILHGSVWEFPCYLTELVEMLVRALGKECVLEVPSTPTNDSGRK